MTTYVVHIYLWVLHEVDTTSQCLQKQNVYTAQHVVLVTYL